jgi:hypothetical protein
VTCCDPPLAPSTDERPLCSAGCSGMRARRYTASGLDYVAMGYRPLPPPPPIDNERRYIGLSIYGVKGRCVLQHRLVTQHAPWAAAHVPCRTPRPHGMCALACGRMRCDAGTGRGCTRT